MSISKETQISSDPVVTDYNILMEEVPFVCLPMFNFNVITKEVYKIPFCNNYQTKLLIEYCHIEYFNIFKTTKKYNELLP